MSTAAGVVTGIAVGILAAPYLAGLTITVPDRDDVRWWRFRPVGRGRLLITAAIAALLGGLGGAAAGWSVLLPAFCALAITTAPLVVIDFEQHRLPNRLVFAAAGSEAVLLTIAAAADEDWHAWLRAVEGAAAVYAVLFLIIFAAPRSFGFGDVKLGGVLGGFLGWFGWLYVYYGIFAGFLLGALVAITLLASRRASLKTAMAFGPMLILGALLVLAFRISPSLA